MLLTYCTCPDNESAETIATALVEQHIVACVNIIPQVKSIYLWEGKLESSQECLLLIKSSKKSLEQMKQTLSSLHPYECPELISVDICEGLKPYIDWVESQSQAQT